MNRIIFLFLIGFIYSSIPNYFSLDKNSTFSKSSSGAIIGLPSNGVIDIGVATDSLIFYGTGGGLGSSVIQDGVPTFFTI